MDIYVHRPLTAGVSAGRNPFQAESTHPGRVARIPARIRRRCGRPQPVRSFDSGGFAACAQDDKAGRAARIPTEEDPLAASLCHQ